MGIQTRSSLQDNRFGVDVQELTSPPACRNPCVQTVLSTQGFLESAKSRRKIFIWHEKHPAAPFNTLLLCFTCILKLRGCFSRNLGRESRAQFREETDILCHDTSIYLLSLCTHIKNLWMSHTIASRNYKVIPNDVALVNSSSATPDGTFDHSTTNQVRSCGWLID
jgi:hypothetical protein